VGFICNLLVSRVNAKHHMSDADVAKLGASAGAAH